MLNGKKRQAGLEHVARLTGWATPRATDAKCGTEYTPNCEGKDLAKDASLCGWATPRAEDAESAGMRHSRGVADTLTAQAGQGLPLAGWSTPDTVPDAPCMGSNATKTTQGLGNQARGVLATSCPAGTGKRGVLRPGHSRWLMGYPAAWDSCGATAMQSCRPSRQSSSQHGKK